MKKINIVTGHYGSGKSNFSTNLALSLAKKGEKVTVVDLDIVNPYFRTADFKELFAENGIELISPIYANTNLDIPAINFDIERLVANEGYIIVDVGGDDAGATALGRYTQPFHEMIDDIDMFYVINSCRQLTKEPSEALELLTEIEKAARFKATALINNSNLGNLTDKEVILNSVEFANKVSLASGLKIAFTSIEKSLECEEFNHLNPFYIEIYVKPLWEI